MTVPSAAPPVRSTAVLRLLSSCPATSSATFGRASKFAPTVPIGMRRSLTQEPVRQRPRAALRARAARCSAIVSTWRASPSTRASSRRSRSSVPVVELARAPRRQSAAFAREQELAALAHESRGRARAPRRRIVAQRGRPPHSLPRASLLDRARQSLTSLCILPPDSEARLAPHRERLRDRPCEASATSRTTASSEQGANPGRMCRARTRRSSCQPSCPIAKAFAAASAGASTTLEAVGVCARVLRPAATPCTTRTPCAARSHVTRSSPDRRRSGATHRSFRWRRPPSHGSRPGSRRSSRPHGSRRRSASATPVPEARHREPDPLVQGPRRRRRVREGARARTQHARVLVDGQPRERRRSARGRRGDRGRRLLPGRPRAREARRRPPSTARRSTPSTERYDDCSRLSVELSFELDWAFVNVGLRAYYAEGSKTLAFEIAEQLGWRAPGRRRRPDRVRGPVLEGPPGLRRAAASSASSTATPPRLYGGQAEGCAPVAAAFAEDRKVTPLTAGHRRALARDRQPRRRRPRGRDREGVGRRDPCRRRGRGRARTWRCSPRRPASSARRPPASRSAPCARRFAQRRARRGGHRRPARHRRRAQDAPADRGPRPARPDRGGRRRAARATGGRRMSTAHEHQSASVRKELTLYFLKNQR